MTCYYFTTVVCGYHSYFNLSIVMFVRVLIDPNSLYFSFIIFCHIITYPLLCWQRLFWGALIQIIFSHNLVFLFQFSDPRLNRYVHFYLYSSNFGALLLVCILSNALFLDFFFTFNLMSETFPSRVHFYNLWTIFIRNDKYI